MKIAPITNFRQNIKFTSEVDSGDLKFHKPECYNYDDDNDEFLFIKPSDEDDDDEPAKVCSPKGCMSSFAIGAAAAAMIIGTTLGVTRCTRQNKFTEDTINLLQSDDIQKDTLLIKDVTGDEEPDLILFKEDGSKVIIDIANQNITEK